jgi:iron(III) transport system substrate-binding protein
MNTRARVFLTIAILAFPVATPAAEDRATAALYEAARKEGRITIYGPSRLIQEGLEKELPKTFPGIEVKAVQLDPPDLAARIITEKRAGQIPADLIMGSMRDYLELIDRGLISRQDYQALGIPKDRILLDGRMVAGWNSVFAHGYNTKLVANRSELPKTFKDLLDPKWKGRMASWEFFLSAGLAFWGLDVGEAAAIDHGRKLVKDQEVLLTRAVSNVVGTGERAIWLFGHVNSILQEQANGAPLDFFFVETHGAAQLGTLIPEGARNVNAARLVTKYLLSDPGRAMLWQYARTGDARPGAKGELARVIAERGGRIVIESEENFRPRAALAGKIRKGIVGQ